MLHREFLKSRLIYKWDNLDVIREYHGAIYDSLFPK